MIAPQTLTAATAKTNVAWQSEDIGIINIGAVLYDQVTLMRVSFGPTFECIQVGTENLAATAVMIRRIGNEQSRALISAASLDPTDATTLLVSPATTTRWEQSVAMGNHPVERTIIFADHRAMIGNTETKTLEAVHVSPYFTDVTWKAQAINHRLLRNYQGRTKSKV